jgi:GAF domain-containing protein
MATLGRSHWPMRSITSSILVDQVTDGLLTKVVNAGFRVNLIVPMLKDNELIGIIGLARKQAQPFTDQQITL